MFQFARDCFDQSAQSPPSLPHSPPGARPLSLLRWQVSRADHRTSPHHSPSLYATRYARQQTTRGASAMAARPCFLLLLLQRKKNKNKKNTHLRRLHEIKQQKVEKWPVYQTAFTLNFSLQLVNISNEIGLLFQTSCRMLSFPPPLVLMAVF